GGHSGAQGESMATDTVYTGAIHPPVTDGATELQPAPIWVKLKKILFFAGAFLGAALIWAAAASAQDRARVEIVPNNPHTGVVTAVAVSPNGTRVVSASGDEIKLWDLASGQLIRTFLGHTPAFEGIQSVAFSPDGARLLSGSDDKTVRL